MRNQRLDLHPSERYQMQKFLHVPILGPTYVRKRVILPFLFVERVIAARPVCARHEELNLFTVHLVPGKAQLYRADVHNPSAITTNIDCKLTWSCGFGGCRDDDTIHPLPVRQYPDLVAELRAADDWSICAGTAGKLDSIALQVSGNNEATLQPYQLSDDLSYEPEA